jgi:ComEC/Rec2-related protein
MKRKYIKIYFLLFLIILILSNFSRKLYISRIKQKYTPENIISVSYKLNPKINDYREKNNLFGQRREGFFTWGSPFFSLQDNPTLSRISQVSASQFLKNKRAISSSFLLILKTIKFFYYSGSVLKSDFWQIKNLLVKNSKKTLDYGHFSLVEGMIFGDISAMDSKFKHDLKVIGMLHVVSASGYNISLLLSLSGVFLRRFFSRKVWFGVALLQIFVYAFMAGWQPAIVRAVIMSTLSLFSSLILYRQYQPLWSLIWTGGIMTLFSFEYLENISFQLSLLSTLGIIVFLPRVKSKNDSSIGVLFGDVLGHQGLSPGKQNHFAVFALFKDSLLVTLAAQSFVLPVVLIHFGELSLFSLVANTFLLWMTPFITVLGVILLIFSWIPFGVGQVILRIISFFAWISIYIFQLSASFLGKFEWSVLRPKIEMHWWMAFLWWSILIFFVFVFEFKKKKEGNKKCLCDFINYL